MKREIEAIRLKTKMSEAFSATRLPYPKQAAAAKQQLDVLQEAYKQLTGDYAKEFIVESESDDAVWIVNEAVRKDGAVVKIGTKYNDANGDTYTIDKMWIADNGKLMAHAKEGGAIDLRNVKIID